MSDWTPLGEIVLLQVQSGEMTGRGSYDTTMLIEAEVLRITSDGVFGLTDGRWVMDRHHRHHPDAKYWHAEDTLSFGFTAHYDHIWDLFRQTPLGIAGENIIVRTAEMIRPDAAASGIRIDSSGDGVQLSAPLPMEPCVEFTRFMTSRPDATTREVKADREKLRDGVRGYSVGATTQEVFEVRPGDHISVRSEGASPAS